MDDKDKIKAAIARLIPLRICAECQRAKSLGQFRRKDLSLRDICNECYKEMIRRKNNRYDANNKTTR